jgi:hypothetical protein
MKDIAWMTREEVIAEARRRERNARAYAILSEMGLAHLADHPIEKPVGRVLEPLRR